ncbi:MAG TPA: 2-phospho-L-lactate transferase [Chloroflexota bacterium]
MRVTVLAGGVGAARFLQGLVQVVPPECVTAIVNTGDDLVFHGLHVSPDLDIIMYTLAGLINDQTGWGIAGDTFACLDFLSRYSDDTWFRLGDRDLATCIHRTGLLQSGQSLTDATVALSQRLGVGVRLLPMSNEPVPTQIVTPDGVLSFQEYFVKRGQRDEVREVHFPGIEHARPAPGVLGAIAEADAIIVAPSNPFVSIGSILAVPGVRQALRERRERTAAVSPIIDGSAVKGPADRMLRSLGVESSAYGVATLYQDFVSTFVIDEQDAALADRIRELGMKVVVAQTIMRGPSEKRALATVALDAARG